MPAVRLALGEAADLFRDGAADPLAGRFETRSGMEVLADQVDPRPAEPVRVELDLDRGDGSPAEVTRIRTAMAGYCAARIERLEIRRDAIRRRGRKELLVGLIFLGLCLAAATLLASATWEPEWLRTFFSEGLVIVGWIALWHPVDMLFFERLPLVREQRVLRRIQSAELVVNVGGAGLLDNAS